MRPDTALVDAVSPSPNFGDRRGRAIDALILHYTGMSTGPVARARLLDPASQVSAHYLVWEGGHIEQLVAEADRAWHAGRAYWAGEIDMNAVSVGIEIVNAGHDGDCPPYPAPQIDAVTRLAADICARHTIALHRVLAHSDVSPDRKCDPGEWFPWATLAKAGVGLWLEDRVNPDAYDYGASGENLRYLQDQLAAFGYLCPISGQFDPATADAVTAFQRHYRPERVDGIADRSTLTVLERLLAIRP